MKTITKETGVRVVRTATTLGALALGACTVLCPPAAVALLPGWVTLFVVERAAAGAVHGAAEDLEASARNSAPQETDSPPPEPPEAQAAATSSTAEAGPAEDLATTSSPPKELENAVPSSPKEVRPAPPVEGDCSTPAEDEA